MASIFLKTPVYITVQEVKDSTSKTGIASLTNDQITVLIYKAQRQIDAYLVQTFWDSLDSEQEFIFPVSKDDLSYLPAWIKEACLYVVEQLYEAWDTVSKSSTLDIKRETMWPRTIEYKDKWYNDYLYIPDIAKSLLDEFKNNFIKQIV